MSENKKIKTQPQRRGGPMGHGGMMGPGEKAKDFKGTMKRLVEYLSVYKLSIIVVFIFAIGSAIFSIVGPKILGKATTKLFEGVVGKLKGDANAAIDFDYIKNIIITLLILYVISAIFSYIQGYIMSGIAQKVSFNMRKAINEKIYKLPLKFFDKTPHGEVISRVTNDVDTVSNTLNQSMSQLITSITMIIGVLVMMFSISVSMTLISLVIIPISFGLVGLIVKKSQKYFKEQQKFLGHVNGQVEEMYSGHTIVKAFNREEKSVAEFRKYNDTLYHSAWKSQFLSGLMMPVMMFIGNLGYVAVTILGGYLAIKNSITVGDIQAFIQYVRQFTQPLAQTANIANILQSTAAAAERVFQFLDEEEEIDDVTQNVSSNEMQGTVEFSNVRFGYSDDKIVINNFSAKVGEGKRIAIVGPTGAGKTTIVKLLMRFYELNGGNIKVGGHDITELKRDDLRKMFGMVLQDTWLFNGTIMENLRYGKIGASDEEVIQASKAAYVDRFVRTLPDGYNLVINEEANNISQGQKQLMTIARAILKDPKILILDEATSSVDTRTEVLIQKAMERLMHGRTSFVIAHRLSTIRDADLILVMKDGDIVEQGNHEELLVRNGFYANLYNSQFEEKEAM